ncbi:MAG: 1-acyl-sn-glycerol-3-phosphate acyltransferase [Tenacibaculum sp.]|nr:1-acyl-sn-glycerol-3-phosphate acyltransferase [Tenacibaculum sp.]
MISKFIFNKILGWKIVGNFPKDVKKYVIIGVPHTSWKDFPLALFVRSILKTEINFVAKKSLFKPPFGFIFKWLGGMPVDRSKSTNLVSAIVDMFKEKEVFHLAISPEGTRKSVEKWKTGFYYIAKGANVPIVVFGYDYSKKQIILSKPFYTTDDIKSDFTKLLDFCKNFKGEKPGLFNNKSNF